jgi:hypothetical protein
LPNGEVFLQKKRRETRHSISNIQIDFHDDGTRIRDDSAMKIRMVCSADDDDDVSIVLYTISNTISTYESHNDDTFSYDDTCGVTFSDHMAYQIAVVA